MGCDCSKARTKKLLTAESRRKHLASHPLIVERKIPSNVEIIREYVDTGFGHMISTACFRSKSWEKDELKGMICYVEGYGSFIDWTDTDTAIEFVRRGYIVITHDHYGHGRSDGNWLTIPELSHNIWVNDAIYIFERAKRKYTPKKYIQHSSNTKLFHYYLLGHSLGGAIAIEISKKYTSSSYYLQVNKKYKNNIKMDKEVDDEKTPLQKSQLDDLNNDYIPQTLLDSYCNIDNINFNKIAMESVNDTLFGFDGLILTAPMVKIKDTLKPSSILITIGTYLANIIPHARIVPTKPINDKLTRDEKYFDFIQKSPLRYDDKPCLRTGFVLLQFCNHIEHTMHKIKLPILILHGEKDQVTDPEMSQILYDKCNSKDKNIKIFSGAFHGLLFDTCRDDVFDEITQWIIKRNKIQ